MNIFDKQFAYHFYWLVGLMMLALLVMDLVSGGEVSLQLPMIFFMGILVTGPLFLLVFVIPTVKFTIQVHSEPRDICLLIWSWVHILFWIFIFNNLLFLADTFVVSQDVIYVVWGGYAVIAASFPILYRLVKKEMLRVFLVLVALACVVLISVFWDPRQGEFSVPSQPSVESLPMLRAAQMGDLRQVQSMLAAGADINARDEIGWDALHIAVFEGHGDLVKFLLLKGADPNSQGYDTADKDFSDGDGCGWVISGRQSVLSTALRLGDAPMAQLLVENGAETGHPPSLRCSAALGDLETLRQHLSRNPGGVEVNFAIKSAASRESPDALAVLLEAGVNPNEGLWNAAAYSRAENIRYLLDHGADANFEKFPTGTPLMSGFNRRSDQTSEEVRDSVMALISSGADVNYVNEFGCNDPPRDVSVLTHAVRKRNAVVVELLLANGADPLWRDSNNMSAVDYALQQGQDDLVKLLRDAQSRSDSS